MASHDEIGCQEQFGVIYPNKSALGVNVANMRSKDLIYALVDLPVLRITQIGIIRNRFEIMEQRLQRLVEINQESFNLLLF